MDVETIKKLLNLKPLKQEGGYFHETYRSPITIRADKLRPGYDGERSLFTVIYYVLTDNDFSAPHRLNSDEIWLFHRGDPIEIKLTHSDNSQEIVILGNDIENGERPQLLIPARTIQSAKLHSTEHHYALVSTVVIPGFEYDDFKLI
ncbi:cupin domain-containing protein [bacterium]|nr:MAG: cupin domain-containing protein [bacterium]